MTYRPRLSTDQMFVGFIFLLMGLFLALAVMDFTIMHGGFGYWPDYWYRYWLSLCLVVFVAASIATWMGYAGGFPKRRLPAVFFTVILLCVAGLLDLFYYFLTVLKGESYSFNVWSVQYKIFVDHYHLLSTWDWPQQIVWSLGCFILIAYIWHKTRE